MTLETAILGFPRGRFPAIGRAASLHLCHRLKQSARPHRRRIRPPCRMVTATGVTLTHRTMAGGGRSKPEATSNTRTGRQGGPAVSSGTGNKPELESEVHPGAATNAPPISPPQVAGNKAGPKPQEQKKANNPALLVVRKGWPGCSW